MVGPAHHVDARALGRQREDRERVRVLAAHEGAHRPEFGPEGAERVAVTARVDEALADCRHDLLVLADERPVRREIHLRVEHRSDRAGNLLAQPDDDIGLCVPCGSGERRNLRTRDLDRILEQFGREPIGNRAGRGMVVVPDRMSGDEPLGEADNAGAVPSR